MYVIVLFKPLCFERRGGEEEKNYKSIGKEEEGRFYE